ncbi:hypothetical protein [Alloprevotella sp. OH1205_COT-284]|nr:hypothetical protein [Alloprevotella sp. OH1205_COT-284]
MESRQDVTAETLKTPRIQFFTRKEMLNQAKAVQRVVMHEP